MSFNSKTYEAEQGVYNALGRIADFWMFWLPTGEVAQKAPESGVQRLTRGFNHFQLVVTSPKITLSALQEQALQNPSPATYEAVRLKTLALNPITLEDRLRFRVALFDMLCEKWERKPFLTLETAVEPDVILERALGKAGIQKRREEEGRASKNLFICLLPYGMYTKMEKVGDICQISAYNRLKGEVLTLPQTGSIPRLRACSRQ